MPHRIALALGSFVLVLTGCGGGGGDAETDEPDVATVATGPLDGVYPVELTVTKATREKTGVPYPRSLALSCADEDCDTLYLRGVTGTATTMDRTFPVTAEGGAVTGEYRRTGPCTTTDGAPQDGTFTEVIALDLTVAADEMSGGYEYTFSGCAENEYVATAALAKAGKRVPLPYLDAADAEALAGPVSAYDAEVKELYDGYAACFTGSAAKDAPCLSELITPWIATFPPLEDALESASAAGSDLCQERIGALDLAGLQSAAQALVLQLGDPATQATGLDAGFATFSGVLSPEHEKVVAALAACVSPVDQSEFGTDGGLAVDVVTSRLVVPAA